MIIVVVVVQAASISVDRQVAFSLVVLLLIMVINYAQQAMVAPSDRAAAIHRNASLAERERQVDLKEAEAREKMAAMDRRWGLRWRGRRMRQRCRSSSYRCRSSRSR